MSNCTHRCVLCGGSLRHDNHDQLTLRLISHANVFLRWHTRCAEEDPLHLRLAEAVMGDDDEVLSKAYAAIVDRCGVETPDQLRDRIDVRKDTNINGMTMRGPGLAWGKLSRRR